MKTDWLKGPLPKSVYFVRCNDKKYSWRGWRGPFVRKSTAKSFATSWNRADKDRDSMVFEFKLEATDVVL